jgi:ribosomal protein S18 acetylase RimI-like enzyme
MTADFLLRRLRADEWRDFREVRLAALVTDPLAFGSTAAREAAYPEEKWREWSTRGSNGSREATFVAAQPVGHLIGMAGVFSEGERFHIWGMWVHPEWRGRGIGQALLDALLGWIDESFGPSVILLDVNPSQAIAVRTYLGSGFEFTGVEQPLGHDPPAVARQMMRPSTSRG